MVHMTTLEKMINEIDPEKIEEFAATIIANTNSRLDPRYLDFSMIDNISEFVSGVSGAYRIYESCYKNGLVLATDDYLWADDNYIVQCDGKYWDKRIVTFYDKAGNQSSKLTYNSILQ